MFENVPWLVPFVSWILAALIIWLLASIPAFALRRLTASLRHGARSVADSSWGFARQSQAERNARISASKAAFVEGLGEQPFDQALHDQWLSDVKTVAVPLDQARAVFSEGLVQTNKLLSEITTVKDQLAMVSGGGDLPEIPQAKDAVAMQRERSAAMLNLWVGSVLLIPIVVYNAQLTAAVIRDAVPNVQGVIAGIPPALAIAIAITLAEAGIGAAHGNASEEGEESGRSYTIGLMVLTLLALVVVGMEFLLYSQLRENSGEFILPIFDATVPPGTAFGLIGLVLGSAVFFLGRLAYTGARGLTRRRAIASVLARYEALRGTARQLNEAAGDRTASLNGLAEQMSHFQDQLRERRLLQNATAFDERVRALLGVRPDWIRPARRALSHGEVVKMESSAFFNIAISVIALFLVSFGLSRLLGSVIPAAPIVGIGAAAALVGLIFIYAGYSLGALRSDRNWGATIGRPVVVLVVAVASVVFGFVVASLTSRPAQVFAIILALATAMLMILIGIGLQASGPFAFLMLRSVATAVLWLPLLFLLSLLYLGWLVVATADELIAIIAQPANLLLSVVGRSRSVQ